MFRAPFVAHVIEALSRPTSRDLEAMQAYTAARGLRVRRMPAGWRLDVRT